MKCFEADSVPQATSQNGMHSHKLTLCSVDLNLSFSMQTNTTLNYGVSAFSNSFTAMLTYQMMQSNGVFCLTGLVCCLF